MKIIARVTILISILTMWTASAESTYAEKLGWPTGSKVVIFHIDDAGLFHDANVGIIEAMEKGVATSTSIMFPCPWASEYVRHIKELEHPKDGNEIHEQPDIGVHLTLTSEWNPYRWGPVAGKKAVPGLTDEQGCLWDSAEEVTKHASADEVETEIRAQLDRCSAMGIKPTHLDSHMGTLFSTPEYMERYVKIGIEKQIPVLMPGGHMECVIREQGEDPEKAKPLAQLLWQNGLPIIDDIHTDLYRWKNTEEKKTKLIAFLKNMRPGITEIILHCTKTTADFDAFSNSGPTRLGDLLTMLDADVKQTIEHEHIILTTWQELKHRRDQIKAQNETTLTAVTK